MTEKKKEKNMCPPKKYVDMINVAKKIIYMYIYAYIFICVLHSSISCNEDTMRGGDRHAVRSASCAKCKQVCKTIYTPV